MSNTWGRIRARLKRRYPAKWATNKAECEEAVAFMETYLAEHPDASERDVLLAAKSVMTLVTLEVLILLIGVAIDLYRVWRDL